MNALTQVSLGELAFQRLARRLEEQLNEGLFAGAALGLSWHGAAQTHCVGVTNVAHPLPVTSKTFFQLGSVSKVITATALIHAALKEKLDLTQPIRNVLPDLTLSSCEALETLTPLHLLSHTSGMRGDVFQDTGEGDDALRKYCEGLSVAPFDGQPGGPASYCNAGFVLAGLVLEALMQKPFASAVKELVFDPCHMQESAYFAREVMTHRYACGHSRDGTPASSCSIPRALHPFGGVLASVDSVLQFANAHLSLELSGVSSAALPAEVVTAMRQPYSSLGENKTACLGWGRVEREGLHFFQHGGYGIFQHAFVMVCPEQRFAFTVLANGEASFTAVEQLVEMALEGCFEISPKARLSFAPAPEKLHEYQGRFVGPVFEVELAVCNQELLGRLIPLVSLGVDEGVVSNASSTFRVTFVADDHIAVIDGPLEGQTATFGRGIDGRVAWMRAGGRVLRCER
jgi:CubicO group peptidase (beta-lactamase class C family)